MNARASLSTKLIGRHAGLGIDIRSLQAHVPLSRTAACQVCKVSPRGLSKDYMQYIAEDTQKTNTTAIEKADNNVGLKYVGSSPA